jgi:hypothetical protein
MLGDYDGTIILISHDRVFDAWSARGRAGGWRALRQAGATATAPSSAAKI